MSDDRYPTFRSYYCPETIREDGAGTLQNLLRERNHAASVSRENQLVARRMRQIGNEEVQLPRTFDDAYLRAIHGHLFQDVYNWAGQYRTVNMVKGDGHHGFGNARTGELEHYLHDMHRIIATTDWAPLDATGFATQTTRAFAYLNQAHPFREGNGRTAKVYLIYLAEQSHYDLDFRRVLPGTWNDASQASRPTAKDDYAPEPAPLVPVFQDLTVPRDLPPRIDLGGGAERLRAASRPDPTRSPTLVQLHPLRPTIQPSGRASGRGIDR